MHPKGTSFGAPALIFFAILGVFAYLISGKNPYFWTDPTYALFFVG
jgi:hypothetical protein